MSTNYMRNGRILLTTIVIAVLAALMFLQVRSFRAFNWAVFFTETKQANLLSILSGVGLLYTVYVLRALRWKIFLRPMHKTTTAELIVPTFIGFTGMALLGRAGDFSRPYLISRRLGLSFSSQIAVWTVERIFDIASFTLLIALNILFSPSLRSLPFFPEFERGGIILVFLVAGLASAAFAVRRNSLAVASGSQKMLTPFSRKLGSALFLKISAFGEGLNTIHNLSSFAQVVGISLLIWILIALSYFQVVQAYPEPLHSMPISHVILLMGFSILGSVVQLPVIGGGAQLMTIGALAQVFEMPQELAVSCGILLWLVTFVSVAPIGLILARREHVSWSKLSKAADQLAASAP